ncbi:MAG: glutathione S-transferase N-terminal domain-containing protein [SAR324 cluster bacterium]|nr:glutathione S-transferase N-terminal domain-containing protein [SAR324 cluster bacterium]
MTTPIDLYYWPTPNGHKITILLEEQEVPYQIIPINISKGDQFEADFLKIAPNNRMPAIVDHEPSGGGEPISIFESGAIMLYLAEEYGGFLPHEAREKAEVTQWLMWQMGGLGPMAGQAHHFRHYAQDKIEYAINRYTDECNRLYGVMDRRLKDRDFLAGEYSIADMACWPWVKPYERQGQDLSEFPNLKRWFETIEARPAVVKAIEVGKEYRSRPEDMTDEARQILFGQTARK